MNNVEICLQESPVLWFVPLARFLIPILPGYQLLPVKGPLDIAMLTPGRRDGRQHCNIISPSLETIGGVLRCSLILPTGALMAVGLSEEGMQNDGQLLSTIIIIISQSRSRGRARYGRHVPDRRR